MVLNEIQEVQGERLDSKSIENVIDKCVDAITQQVREYEGLLDEHTLDVMLCGHVFEELALDYLLHDSAGVNLDKYPELSQFLLANMRDIRKIEVVSPNFREETKIGNSTNAIKNPDALEIGSSEEGVPLVIGAVEVKFARLSDMSYRVSRQLGMFHSSISHVTNAYKDRLATAREGLGLEDILPSSVDTVGASEFRITVVHPQDVFDEYTDLENITKIGDTIKAGIPGHPNTVLLFIPMTRKYVELLATQIKDKVLERLPEDVKLWIVPDEWVD